MKVNIELDISPAEARELFGLTDFTDLHHTITNDFLNYMRKGPIGANAKRALN